MSPVLAAALRALAWGLAGGAVVALAAWRLRSSDRAGDVLPAVTAVVTALAMAVVAVPAGTGWRMLAATTALAVPAMIHALAGRGPAAGVGPAAMATIWMVGAAVAGALVLADPSLAWTVAVRAAVLAAAAVLAGGMVLTGRHGDRPAVLVLVTVAVVFGLYLCVPETAPTIAAGAVLVPVTVVTVLTERRSPRPAFGLAAAPLAVPFVALPAQGGSARDAVVAGGIACAGLLVVWPAVRLARRSRPGPPRLGLVPLAATQALAAVVIARAGVVRASNGRCAAVVAAVYVATAAACWWGERRAALSGPNGPGRPPP